MLPSASGPNGSQSNKSCPTVLIVEDEVLIRLMVGDALRDAGYHVIEACDSDEALSIVDRAIQIDLVLTDVRMPGPLDGLALLGMIRQRRPGVPVIVMSGHLEERQALDGGAVQFLSKPFRFESAVQAVQKSLENV